MKRASLLAGNPALTPGQELQPPKKPRFRLSIRAALMIMAATCFVLSWHLSVTTAERRLRSVTMALERAKAALEFSESRNRLPPSSDDPPAIQRGVLSGSRLVRANLKGATVTGADLSFQQTVLQECDLSDAKISGGASSFQRARFDRSNLCRAQLTGREGAFQLSSFAGANLQDASLIGADAAFQGATFAGANLIDARIAAGVAGFQRVDLSGAQLQGADLSGIERLSLESCVFQQPPTYDARTRFPKFFDPQEAGWLLANP